LSEGNSLLRGTEGPICQPDPSHWEVCCLPGARVTDITRKLPGLMWSYDYYPLLLIQVGRDKITERSPKAIKETSGHCSNRLKDQGHR